MKKRFFKVLSAALAGIMLLSAAPVHAESAPEIKDLNIFTYTYMGIPEQARIDAVLEKVNEIMNPLGVNVNLELTTSAAY